MGQPRGARGFGAPVERAVPRRYNRWLIGRRTASVMSQRFHNQKSSGFTLPVPISEGLIAPLKNTENIGRKSPSHDSQGTRLERRAPIFTSGCRRQARLELQAFARCCPASSPGRPAASLELFLPRFVSAVPLLASEAGVQHDRVGAQAYLPPGRTLQLRYPRRRRGGHTAATG